MLNEALVYLLLATAVVASVITTLHLLKLRSVHARLLPMAIADMRKKLMMADRFSGIYKDEATYNERAAKKLAYARVRAYVMCIVYLGILVGVCLFGQALVPTAAHRSDVGSAVLAWIWVLGYAVSSVWVGVAYFRTRGRYNAIFTVNGDRPAYMRQSRWELHV